MEGEKMNKKTTILLCSLTAATGMLTAAPLSVSAAAFTDEPSASSWYKDKDGQIFYYNKNKEVVTGEITIGGQTYLFSDNGVLKTGWRTVDGMRRYYDPETGQQQYDWIEYGGRKYYFTLESGKKTGFCTSEDGYLCFLDEFGALVEEEGFASDGKNCAYIGSDGHVVTSNTTIDGIPYIISEDGAIATGWQIINGKKYYFSTEHGQALTGFNKIGDDFYLFSADGGMLIGEQSYNGTTYLFDLNGKMQTGWQTINNTQHYFYSNSGNPANGIAEIDGKKYIIIASK